MRVKAGPHAYLPPGPYSPPELRTLIQIIVPTGRPVAFYEREINMVVKETLSSGKRPRTEREKKTVRAMVEIYCRDRHSSKGGLCDECGELLDYADLRLDKCPFQEEKTTCANCPVHCYQPAMREKMKEVMRYSGPRMTYQHPVLALRHMLDGRKKPAKK